MVGTHCTPVQDQNKNLTILYKPIKGEQVDKETCISILALPGTGMMIQAKTNCYEKPMPVINVAAAADMINSPTHCHCVRNR